MKHAWNWQERLRAATIHLGLSIGVALLAALLVFIEWYPYPYREISGGRELFILLTSVDVVIGPLITFAIFNRAKPWRELKRDLAIVGVLQLSALIYGLHTVYLARPVHLVFEIDRFRVVAAADIPEDALSKTPPGVDALPLFGPTLLAVRPFRDSVERSDFTFIAVRGISLSAQPALWEPYDNARDRVKTAARPLEALTKRFPQRSAQIDALLASAGRGGKPTVWLPLAGRKTFWTVFIDPATAEPVAFMPLDSF
ncbi:MAG TPA: TfpX/TfpZ family type IV pilin accessory protein [Ramlibacter sp.]|uniref:TfpX/TfpZ family type IV pilin accessory protein n=1 Tax=Ramlibacter sp. TaxID=1917967 RepID=UPI002C6B8C20|nr:TfpX/TfpZ family type IV pilin accessory protein [Ramlibacter sp.]HVZ47071.1 TfpX/TfpZ family type IV pilin accessory protein [Ramlibacter sp.]